MLTTIPLNQVQIPFMATSLPTPTPGPENPYEPAKDETEYLRTREEWRNGSDLLATATQRYLGACLALEASCSDLNRAFGNAPSVLMTLHDMDEELSHLGSLQRKLERARTVLARSRNRSPQTVSINRLPHEILAHIFELAVLSEFWRFSTLDEHDFQVKPGDEIDLPYHPCVLSEVCTYWHRLAIDTPTLWSYIHLIPHSWAANKFYARASLLVKRAIGVPLHICIHSSVGADPSALTRLTGWLVPVLGRIYSLDMSGGSPYFAYLDSVLDCLFNNGTPGSIKELTLWGPTHEQPRFIDPASSSSMAVWRFNLSQQQLEAFFQPITLLRLGGVFPRWDSQAYRGLAHLQLDIGSIAEAPLICILSDNPQLRTLSLGLEVTEIQPRHIPQKLILLCDLEILSLVFMELTQVWAVLRLIAPGPRPLRVAFGSSRDNLSYDFAGTDEARAFFQRSNVTTCHLTSEEDCDNEWFPKTLKSLPHLRTLGLQDQSYMFWYNAGAVCAQLRELCMINCKILLDAFKKLLRAHSVQVLRLQRCKVFFGEEEVEAEALVEELSEYVPNVKCYKGEDDYSDPYLNWGFVKF
ncbi:hypothetical protein FRC10_010784 [Ceratobasidium sp. 414]|nr:hypothetical protein FRC10_010784 [Ceratobasidium sp. 414]